MSFSKEIKVLSSSDIIVEADHLFWSKNPETELLKSLERAGQLAPVLVENIDEGWLLLAGRGRVAALDQLGSPVQARVSEKKLSPVQRGMVYLEDNIHRVPDEGMCLAALKFFSSFLSPHELKQDVMPFLGINPKNRDARLYLDWIDLPESFQESLRAGRIPLAAAKVLVKMPEADILSVVRFFSDLSWSRSNAVNFLTWLYESTRSKGVALAELPGFPNLSDVLGHDASPKDKLAQLVAVARTIRYPELTKLRDRFDGLSREMSSGSPWRIVQSRNFESGAADLTVSVGNAEQLEKAVRTLADLAENRHWQELWKIGSGSDD